MRCPLLAEDTGSALCKDLLKRRQKRERPNQDIDDTTFHPSDTFYWTRKPSTLPDCKESEIR